MPKLQESNTWSRESLLLLDISGSQPLKALPWFFFDCSLLVAELESDNFLLEGVFMPDDGWYGIPIVSNNSFTVLCSPDGDFILNEAICFESDSERFSAATSCEFIALCTLHNDWMCLERGKISD